MLVLYTDFSKRTACKFISDQADNIATETGTGRKSWKKESTIFGQYEIWLISGQLALKYSGRIRQKGVFAEYFDGSFSSSGLTCNRNWYWPKVVEKKSTIFGQY